MHLFCSLPIHATTVVVVVGLSPDLKPYVVVVQELDPLEANLNVFRILLVVGNVDTSFYTDVRTGGMDDSDEREISHQLAQRARPIRGVRRRCMQKHPSLKNLLRGYIM